MDLMAGLRAGANFGTGFENAQAQAQNNQYTQQMQALALQNAKQTTEQNAQNASYAQQESDYAKTLSQMSSFNPVVRDPQSRQPIGQAPQQPAQPSPDQQAKQQQQFYSQMAAKATQLGDISRAAQFSTMAMNIQTEQVKQQQLQATAQESELKRQAMSHSAIAQVFSGVQDEQSFEQKQQEVLSNPALMMTPQEKQHFAALKYSPQLVQQITMGGMTSAQQAASKLSMLRFNSQQRYQQARLEQEAQKTHLEALRTAADISSKVTKEKVGAVEKAPSKEQLSMVDPSLQTIMFGKPLTGEVPDPNSTTGGSMLDPRLMTSTYIQARQNITARAQQMVQNNRGLSFPQAVDMAVQEAKVNGQLVPEKPLPDHTQMPGYYAHSGNTKETAIPFHAGIPKEDLIPDKVYTMNGTYRKWTKEGWIAIH